MLNMSEYCMSDNSYFSSVFKNHNNAATGPKYIDSFNTMITKNELQKHKNPDFDSKSKKSRTWDKNTQDSFGYKVIL